jgi:NAD-dependent DNA ligase
MKPITEPDDPRLIKMHEQRLIARDIDQLLAVCEFSLQDGCIDEYEAASILDWLRAHRLSLDTWPANVLYDRLTQMLSDGVLDEDEQTELLSLVASIVRPATENIGAAPATLPLNDPIPVVIVPERSFCFTGVFDFGSRAECMKAITDRGGDPAKAITKKLNYLVIGNIGSGAWKHTSFGAKIIKAVEYRNEGAHLAIISEKHWTEVLNQI